MTKKNIISNLIATIVFSLIAIANISAATVTPSTEEIQLVEGGNYKIDFYVQFDKAEQMNRLEARDKETCGCALYDIIEAPEIDYMSTGGTLSFEFGNISDGIHEYFIEGYDDYGELFFYYEGAFNVLPIPVPTVSENTVSENSVSENTVSQNTTEEEEIEYFETEKVEESNNPVEISEVKESISIIEENNADSVITTVEEIKDDFFEDQDIEEIDLDEEDEDSWEDEIVVNDPTIKIKSKKGRVMFKIRSDKGTRLQVKYSKTGKKFRSTSKKNLNIKTKKSCVVKARAYIDIDGERYYSDWVVVTGKSK